MRHIYKTSEIGKKNDTYDDIIRSLLQMKFMPTTGIKMYIEKRMKKVLSKENVTVINPGKKSK
jgi:hypothetical protein